MLRDQNNPHVLAAISDIVKSNRDAAVKFDQKVTESRSNKYGSFKPQEKTTKNVELQEELSPKQKNIAKLAGNKEKIDAADLKKLRSGKDTPGNGYNHQCAVHVKHSKLGEGRTIHSQHAEPDEGGQIAWYDVMFEHGIEKQVQTAELEILVSESHGNHTKKA